ncbi:putative insig domain-protein [Diplogelasinospora grovesii]|uniref:Insig domain-protein n=1 Tax=Diplogelasinospora grovesii TaxID=303347 RepID=A0AAN6NHK5_9PEZI|nr:putative insig domain-protein [Diplogelasinospora grovesii]
MDNNPPKERPSDGGDGPRIIRPIPRRPFENLNFISPTPPDSDSSPPTPAAPATISANDLRFLDPRWQAQQEERERESSISRAASLLNLTAGTLYGIYSPTASTPNIDRFDDSSQRDGAGGTPWGALTPARPRPTEEDEEDEYVPQLVNVVNDRRRPSPSSSSTTATLTPPQESTSVLATSLVLRAMLLFGLGMGYGVLVTRLPNRNQQPFEDVVLVSGGGEVLDWRYLAFWGVAGVALGSLLPWFDAVWESTFAAQHRNNRKHTTTTTTTPPSKESTVAGGGTGRAEEEEEEDGGGGGERVVVAEVDWALVVRGIGAFVGIVFAIRRLPWTSTMQVSLTLALANPFLWYLIDRSKPGFLLSAAVGLTGSAVLMGLNHSDMMPSPITYHHTHVGVDMYGNTTATGGGRNGGGGGQETIENGIWMLSVLFCSCVCFGNIGRRLALNRSAAGRGRWGGVR